MASASALLTVILHWPANSATQCLYSRIPSSVICCIHVRCCLSCGETVYLAVIPPVPIPHDPTLPTHKKVLSSYSYSDIQMKSGLGIRLVFLLPGDNADPLHCLIHDADVQDKPQYEAVPYTWATEDGDDTKSARVYCDDAVIPVTVNCEAALRRLRFPSMGRVLWIDSICINQLNIKERSHQVGDMDKIYKNALAVQICIHDPGRDCSRCLRRLQGHDNSYKDAVIQTAELFRRRYFHRVWVIQEVLLAKSAVFLVNVDSTRLTEENRDRMRRMCNRHQICIPALLAQAFKLQTATVGILKLCLDILMNSSYLDPRDKLYGILGMLKPNLRTYLPVDYTLPLTQVYEKAITACVVDNGNLSILCHARILDGSKLFTLSVFGLNEFMQYLQSSPVDGQPMKLHNWSRWKFRVALQGEQKAVEAPWLGRDLRNELESLLGVREFIFYENISPRSEIFPLRNWRIEKAFEYGQAVEVLENVTSPNQLVHGFSVRAHFIDDVIGGGDNAPQDLARKMCEENTDFTSTGYKWTCSLRPQKSGTPKSWLEHFGNMKASYEVYGHIQSPHEYFYTRYTVGSSLSNFRQGDEVFTLDGVPCPLLLRKVQPNRYQIVVKCYIVFRDYLQICNASRSTNPNSWSG